MAKKEMLDLFDVYSHLYKPNKAIGIGIVDVPPLPFLMIDGQGNPNTSDMYKHSVEALYSLAFTMKFTIKKAKIVDYVVMPLEGLWWAEDMSAFSLDNKDNWLWRMMILTPDLITPEHVEQARADALVKKPELAEFLPRVRLDTFHEGQAAQLVHTGPYADEAPNIQRLHAFIHEQGGQLSGYHHEIYLNDPNRSKPENLKTILRQPFTSGA